MSKVILITGASSGMGKVTAEELIKEGHTVYCAARSVEKMKDLENLGGKIIKMDVSDSQSIGGCLLCAGGSAHSVRMTLSVAGIAEVEHDGIAGNH